MVTVPVRDAWAVLVATVMPTVPLPDPVAPLLTTIQEAVLAALHVQPVSAVTLTLAECPLAAAWVLPGLIE